MKKNIFVISSKKFTSLKGAIAQMRKWENKGTLDPKAKIYGTKTYYSILRNKLKKKITKYSGGGYVKEEHPMAGVTVLEMDGKGWYKKFAKNLFK